MQESTNFLLAFTGVASTLAGFTLASYSIYTNKASTIATDPLCRRYGLKEFDASHSLNFIFLTLTLFLVPLLTSLTLLVVQGVASLPPVLYILWATALLCAILWSLIAKRGALTYVSQVDSFERLRVDFESRKRTSRVKQVNINEPGVKSKRKALERKAAKFFAEIMVPLVLIGDVVMALVSLWPFAPSGSLVSYLIVAAREINLTVLMFADILSLACGVLMLYSYFRLFDTRKLLFEIDDGTRKILRMASDRIVSKCNSLVELQKSFRLILDDPDRRWVNRLAKERHLPEQSIKALIDGAVDFARGSHWDLETEKGGVPLIDAKPYHLDWINNLLKWEAIPHDQFVLIMTGIEIYTEGLNRFEADMKERLAEYQSLARFVDTNRSLVCSEVEYNE
jgi:hypothetical protein